MFAGGFWSLLGLLLARNAALFTAVVYERGDYAANAILVGQAKHFDLLVGNYSRLGFSHPGPAFLYVQGFGEWLFHDLLAVVPSPWNGQWLALLVLTSALVALAVTIVGSWIGYGPRLALCAAAALGFLAVHGQLVSMPWMPYLYGPPFLLLLTAAASVAAGRTRHLWAFALAGGLLAHGHAEFLLFVPALAGYALVLAWRRHGGLPGGRQDWARCAAVVAVFALPVLINLVLRWPGEFGKYLSYGDSRGLHGPGATAEYLQRFWVGGPVAASALAVVLFGAVAAGTRLGPAGSPRRFLTAGLGAAALATVLFAAYISFGIDDLSQDYVGYFFRAVPLFLLLLAVAGLPAPAARTGALSGGRRLRYAAVLPVLAAFLVAGRSISLSQPLDTLPETPRVLATLSAHAGGGPVVLRLEQPSWPEMTALVVAGKRTGQRVCVRDQAWRFMVTSDFVCTDGDIAAGRVRGECGVLLRPATAPPPALATALIRIGASVGYAGPGRC